MRFSKIELIAILMALLALLVGSGSILYSKVFVKQNVAYIRSKDLVYGYLGMKDVQNKLNTKEDSWKANIDTLKNDYERSLSKYRSDAPTLKPKEKEGREKYLFSQKQSLENYEQAINKKMQDESTKLTEGVLNQINGFVADYGKQHGYDMIIGTTTEGNLLYAKPDMDITEVVLKELNQNYKGDVSKN